MAATRSIKLLLNDDDRDHRAEVVSLIQNANQFECLVAFAKHSVWAGIKKPLEEALARGMRARFAIGLNFYHTDPEILRKLWWLSNRYQLELFLSDVDCTFHPKIYAYRLRKGCKIVIGSANFTQGGLTDNYEASVLIDDPNGMMMSSITAHFDDLIEEKAIVPASRRRIEQYASEHEIHAVWFQFATRRAHRSVATGDISLDALANYLVLMREGGTKSQFETQLKIRRENLAQSPTQLRTIAAWQGTSEKEFLAHYDRLIGLFHSGGLARAKTRISARRNKFAKAISAILHRDALSPREAFSILQSHLVHIKGAGINLLTEILHALDNKRFAVMNQNSISGLRLAGYDKFPQHPTKSNVSPDLYQLYCDNAEAVRHALQLNDFTELDALFNYVYWHDGDEGEDE